MIGAVGRCVPLAAVVVVATIACSSSDVAPTLGVENFSYGPDPMQEGDLLIPHTDSEVPVVTLIHGGYWAAGFDRRSMEPLAEEIASLGYAVWNIDYRRVGDSGGGWPGTLEDIGAAIDHLAALATDHELDLAHHVAIGHSAGSQLAFWSAARADAVVQPTALISLSGVLDLTSAAQLPDIGRAAILATAVQDFLGGDLGAVPQRFGQASPIGLLPLEVPQLVVHGVVDDRVPLSQSQDYATVATAAGDPVELVLLREADHFDVMDTDADWWPVVAEWLPEVLEGSTEP